MPAPRRPGPRWRRLHRAPASARGRGRSIPAPAASGFQRRIHLRALAVDAALATLQAGVLLQAVAAVAELFAQVLAHERHVVRMEVDLRVSLRQLQQRAANGLEHGLGVFGERELDHAPRHLDGERHDLSATSLSSACSA
jgi:hypothetical protein